MKRIYLLACLGLIVIASCQSEKNEIRVKIKNGLAMQRQNETVELSRIDLGITDAKLFDKLSVFDDAPNQNLLSQLIDYDGDGINDGIIFQANVAANGEAVFKIAPTELADTIASKVFSRFVPERTDDYAWENDKVAFRTYGPVAQKMVEEGTSGGTLSSGMDCWLKKVDYPVINKWYEKHTTGAGSYHEDTGEGYDPYHVGTSRGCGGLGFWESDSLFVSKNFIAYNTLANGPIRTEFDLDYANWQASGKSIKEQKNISLDLGSNLMLVKAHIEGVDTITLGLTLHENKGETHADTINFCFSYWETIDNSELGTGIVVAPEYYLGYTKFVSPNKDQSQLLVHLKVINGQVEYYTGFGWKESGLFNSFEAWNAYLQSQAIQIQNPLEIEILK
jgi:hypothetical protein